MYSTCTFCHARLGANQVVEVFPVGRRLAFDPEKGRLWALCPRCRQWNLSPIEERWEALEALERLYRDTPKRYGTEHIGLARHGEGLEVVRIGRPTRPEYAAWRYGGELLRRRRKAIALGTAGAAVGVAILGGVSAGVLAGGAFGMVNFGLNSVNLYRSVFRTAARIEGPDGERFVLKQRHAAHARLAEYAEAEAGWALRLRCLPDTPEAERELRRRARRGGLWGSADVRKDPEITLSGDAAVRAAGRILPALNHAGASRGRIRDAVGLIERAGSPEATFRQAVGTVPSAARTLYAPARPPQDSLFRLPAPVRLALEMAAHEESERRALEGELARLEREWREAEEIAAIADDLLLPARVRDLLRR